MKDIVLPVLSLHKSDATGIWYRVVKEGNVDIQDFASRLGGMVMKRGDRMYIITKSYIDTWQVMKIRQSYGLDP